MGVMVEGSWQVEEPSRTDDRGRVRMPPAKFRHWVTPDGEPGPTGDGGFPAEAGRYHLYVSRACPWSHRATLMHELKGLQDVVGLSVAHWLVADDGWTFEEGPGVVTDGVNGARFVWQIYAASDATYSGPATLPVLWDTREHRIVSNDSGDIMRMFNSAFDAAGASGMDYYPKALRDDINALTARIHDTVNEGVYAAGFAGSQQAYEDAVEGVFETLDWLERSLADQPYLCGEVPTEADWRLFPTLLRFDAVYHGLFKCNLRRIADYPALWRHTCRLHGQPGVRDTVDFDHIKRHYYQSYPRLNPGAIVPVGPVLDFDQPDAG
jgi:glutathionyl-hydroquinone reductase